MVEYTPQHYQVGGRDRCYNIITVSYMAYVAHIESRFSNIYLTFFPTPYGTDFFNLPAGSYNSPSLTILNSALSDATIPENISPSPPKPFCMWKHNAVWLVDHLLQSSLLLFLLNVFEAIITYMSGMKIITQI